MKLDCNKIRALLRSKGVNIMSVTAKDGELYLKVRCPFTVSVIEKALKGYDWHLEAFDRINYSAASDELREAYFQWRRDHPYIKHSVASFAAGWNACRKA